MGAAHHDLGRSTPARRRDADENRAARDDARWKERNVAMGSTTDRNGERFVNSAWIEPVELPVLARGHGRELLLRRDPVPALPAVARQVGHHERDVVAQKHGYQVGWIG